MNLLQGLTVLAVGLVAMLPVFLLLRLARPASVTASSPRVERGLIVTGLTVCLLLLGMRSLLIYWMEAAPVALITSRELPVSSQTVASADLFRGIESEINLRPYPWRALPRVAPSPVENPPSAAKISLGKRLFFDPNLSLDRSLSCASCHALEAWAGGDGEPVSVGIDGQRGDRNAPTVWNAAFQARLFWDGRARSLEEQALQPMLNPVEMGMPSARAVVERVQAVPAYPPAFRAAFGDPAIDIERIARAIASYERTLITADSPYDDFVRGDASALSDQQLNGMALFADVGCVLCHGGPNFSAASVFDPGLPLRLFPANPSALVAEHRLLPADGSPAAWRVPSLRNVALTGPWFHNGRVDDLREVVRIMASTQLGRRDEHSIHWSANRLTVVDNAALTEGEIDDIVAFLHALSSRRLVEARQ